MLFDSSTQKWAELATGINLIPIGWSRDSKYFYFASDGISRVRIIDRKLNVALRLRNIRLTGTWGQPYALAPDDSLLLLRDAGTQELYALDIQFP
jgi:hypothetical protein